MIVSYDLAGNPIVFRVISISFSWKKGLVNGNRESMNATRIEST